MNTKYGNSLIKYDQNQNRNKSENKWSFLTVELFILIYVWESDYQGMSKESNSSLKTMTSYGFNSWSIFSILLCLIDRKLSSGATSNIFHQNVIWWKYCKWPTHEIAEKIAEKISLGISFLQAP